MKARLFLLLFLSLHLCLSAENYPYRSDYLWVTVPDHADWLYSCGENATIDIQLYKYGIPRTATVAYTLADDMLDPDRKGTVEIKSGRGTLCIGSRKTPGFRDLALTATLDGKTYRHHVKVGFSVGDIRPYTQEPKDFLSFWETQAKSLADTRLKYTREPAPEYTTDKIVCELIKLRVDRTHYIYGYLTRPRGAEAGRCPVVICPPGAGIKTIKEPLRHKYYAEHGFLRFEMEIHGLDPRLPEATFREIQSAFASKGNNYLENGLDSRDNYYMRHVYLSLLRAVEFMTSLPEWDGRNVAFQGGSQGGALSLIGAALSPKVTQCAANHPALADMAAYSVKGRTGGYPHFNHIPGMLTKEKMSVMSYYDVVNFARHITCPVFLTWGYNDVTCPPTTSYAVWNTLTCPKEPLITPVNEHWTSEETEYAEMEWIKKHLI